MVKINITSCPKDVIHHGVVKSVVLLVLSIIMLVAGSIGSGNVVHDMDGTRNGRLKWFHVIENVSVVIFTASLIEYSQVLWEDTRKNRMKESRELLTGVLNFELIHHSPLVVVFSQAELLERAKIKKLYN